MLQIYSDRRAEADVYVPSQIRILSEVLRLPESQIAVSDLQTDWAGTDFIAGGLRIAGRVRKPKWLRFVGEFTIRTSIGRDGLSELDKVVQGTAADFMLYGFGQPDNSISPWFLIDLEPVRLAARTGWQCVPVHYRSGADCEMISIPYSAFAAPIILASSESELPAPDASCSECRRRLALQAVRSRTTPQN